MKKIIVAGAGHAGLVAGALLARNGFDVTVIEKGERQSLGHDWEDRFAFPILTEITGIEEKDFPADSWRFRGDCAFVSPAKRKKIVINYDESNRQKIMKRKSLISMLLGFAEENGVKFIFGCEIISAIVSGDRVTGVRTASGDYAADLVIDAAGAFSPVRSTLPESFGIEKMPRHGDLFYAYRAYYNRLPGFENPAVPFEVYMYHEGEQGLSWFCTNENSADVLIGRIDKFGDEKLHQQLEIFAKDHPWLGSEILNGGNYAAIPVRRPLTLMVASGYAAAGDSAFMTMPMNGMGIDLSLRAGELLAKTVISKADTSFDVSDLWAYNRDFHRLYGGDAAKNEGLKNAILSIPSEGVDFLFESGVIAASDLSGAGKNMNFKVLMGKFVNGMKQPKYFFAIVNGLIKGSGASGLYKKAPGKFDREAVRQWSAKIEQKDIRI